jgi:hypothetical protein
MNKKPPTEAAKIAEYRLHAAARRARSRLQSNSGAPEPGVTIVEGVVTVTQVVDSIPLSRLGGATIVLGRSIICIPELKIRREKK